MEEGVEVWVWGFWFGEDCYWGCGHWSPEFFYLFFLSVLLHFLDCFLLPCRILLRLPPLDPIINLDILLKTIHRYPNILYLLQILLINPQQRNRLPTLKPQLPIRIRHQILHLLIHILLYRLLGCLLRPLYAELFTFVEVLPECVEFLGGLDAGWVGF